MSARCHRPRMARFSADLRERGIESISCLGRYDYSVATTGLAPHLHERTMEICFLIRGRQAYSVGNKMFYMQGGDVFITQPDETHSTGGGPQEKGLLYWINILKPSATSGRLLGLPRHQTRAVWERLSEVSPRVFGGTPAMKLHLDAIAAQLDRPRNALLEIEMAGHLVSLLLEVIAARGTHKARKRTDNWLTRVMQHIQSQLATPESTQDAIEGNTLVVEKLAEIAGLSPSRFKAKFKDHTGIPPAEYVVRERVERAAAMIRETPGASITEIAFALGFSSSQYFASVFKRIRGMTPRDFAMRRNAIALG
ncbi:hypothetical protein DB346_14090 [Verrucomicrobia bacterium LW23]|nr:hypothetical protein DB346_14090 [Verrucomicrobia bacterium LW23]